MAHREFSSASELDQFSAMVEHIYDCALMPELWQGTVAEMGRLTRSSMTSIHIFDVATRDAPLAFTDGVAPDFQRSMQMIYGPMWSNIIGIPQLKVGEPKLLDDLIAPEEFLSTRFYLEWVKPQNQRWWAGMVLLRQGNRLVIQSNGRTIDEPGYDESDRSMFNRLAPHLCRAMAISDILDLASWRTKALETAMDGLAAGVFLTNAVGDVVYMNRAADALVSAGETIGLHGRRLSPRNGQASHALDNALRNEAGSKLQSAQIALPSADAGGMIANVLPVASGERRDILHPLNASHAVFVQNPKQAVALPGEAFATLYKLTLAQNRLVALLAQNLTLQEASAQLGISMPTIRSHLQQLFEKTGTARQAELVTLFWNSMPPTRQG
jgi:DNA-binding CsgD family transcriptional regulator/PAS domain-containing protein